MKDSAYAFAVSAVRVRETGLLSRAQTESLITAQDESAVLRLLEDYGYAGITADPEGVLNERMNDVTAFVKDISPDTDLLSFLFIKNDFHNLKAAMKCSVAGADPDKYFMPAATVSTDSIKTAVAEKQFGLLPEMMRKPAAEAWDALLTGMSGQLLETVLDRAAIESAVRIAEESRDPFCIGLAEFRRKLSSFLIAYRCAAAGKNSDFVKLSLPDITEPPRDKLIAAVLAGADEVTSLAGKCGITLPESATASDIQRAADTLEDEYISGAAFVSMGIAPVIAYYLRAEREVSRIRVILSCKRCGLSDDVCRERAGL